MKKAILIVVIVFIVVATLFVVLNYDDYIIKSFGTSMIPVELVGTWNDSLQLYVSPSGDTAYAKCTHTSNEDCQDYPPKYSNAYHRYDPYGPNGEFVLDVNREFFYFYEQDGCIYLDSVRMYDRLYMMSTRWQLHDMFGAPEFPSVPEFSDYVGGNEDILTEIVDFFRWLGDCFMFFFDAIAFIFETIAYYFEFITIFFEELLL